MKLQEIGKEYFNLFVKNPKNLQFFMMYRNVQNLNINITKQTELENQRTEELSL